MRVKPYEEFSTPVKLAIDITYVAYYGGHDEMERIQGIEGYEEKEYDWCHKFATANVVSDNTQFVVTMLPVGDPYHHDDDAYPGKEKSYRPGAVVRDLLEIVEDFLSPRVVYADREFLLRESRMISTTPVCIWTDEHPTVTLGQTVRRTPASA